MRFAICNELFESWTWTEVCEYVSRVGYEGLEIAPFTLAENLQSLSDQKIESLKSEAESYGLNLIGLHWLLAKTQGLHLCHADPQVLTQTADHLRRLANCCAHLGGGLMVLGSPQQRSLDPGVTVAEGNRRARQVIEAILPTLESNRVTLALEPLGPQETNFWNTAASVMDFMASIGSPWVRLHLDVKAMASEPKTFAEIIRSAAGQVVHVHANDPNRLGPGMGEVDFAEIIPELKAIGYDDWLSVEVFDYSPGPQAIAEKSIEYLKRFVNSE